ncbi:hypothetical protein RJ641_001559 [Dillenia turbinata]|uniref:Uncharacterized protein n=1 Tax=Dillenia turbinata TaxID=194707 RepID=A0AAN8ZEK7_9MAGN
MALEGDEEGKTKDGRRKGRARGRRRRRSRMRASAAGADGVSPTDSGGAGKRGGVQAPEQLTSSLPHSPCGLITSSYKPSDYMSVVSLSVKCSLVPSLEFSPEVHLPHVVGHPFWQLLSSQYLPSELERTPSVSALGLNTSAVLPYSSCIII